MEIYWIIGGMFVLPGVVLGIYEAVRQVFGYSNAWLFGEIDLSEKLGILPVVLIQTAMLSVFFPFIEMLEWESSKAGTVALVFLLVPLQVSIREIPNKLWRIFAITVSSLILGGISGEFTYHAMRSVAGGVCAGGIMALFELLVIEDMRKRAPQKNYHIIPFWTSVLILGNSFGLAFAGELSFYHHPKPGFYNIVVVAILILNVVLASGVGLWLIVMGHYFISYPIFSLRKMVSFPLLKLFIGLRNKTCLCRHCFRYTHPLKSTYRLGHRFCEYCQQEVEEVDASEKLVMVFGELPLKFPKRTFVFINPDVDAKDQPIDISEIYIDTQTCNRVLLERFITYLMAYPPEHGLQSVKLFYQGDLHQLGTNLKNVLSNNFKWIELIPKDIQHDENATGLPQFRLLKSYQKPSSPFLPSSPAPINKRIILRGMMKGLVVMMWSLFLASILIDQSQELTFVKFLSKFHWIFWFVLGGISLAIGIIEGIHGSSRMIKVLLFCLIAAVVIPGMLSSLISWRRTRTTGDFEKIRETVNSRMNEHNCFLNMEKLDPQNPYQILYARYPDDVQDDEWDKSSIPCLGSITHTLTYGNDTRPGTSGSEFDNGNIYRDGEFISPSTLGEQ